MNFLLKHRFRVRTRSGTVVDNIVIAARDQADAERRLQMMYPRAQVLDCEVKDARAAFAPGPAGRAAVELPSFEQLLGAMTSTAD
jgi:hypothetical protein